MFVFLRWVYKDARDTYEHAHHGPILPGQGGEALGVLDAEDGVQKC
jgi:hypothetical protein